MAPEQCDPPATGRPGPPADVWGLGATLYRAAAGYLPFDVEGAQQRSGHDRWPQLTQPPAALPREIPDALVKPVLACLDPDPAARPTATELARELEPLVMGLPKPVLGGFRARR